MAWATLGFGQEINFRGHLCRKPSITSHHTPKLVPLLFVPISPYPLYYIHLGCPPNSCCCYFFSKLCPTPYDPMDYSLPGSTAHGILQARILERVAISFSGGSSLSRDGTKISYIAGGFLTAGPLREPVRCSNREEPLDGDKTQAS